MATPTIKAIQTEYAGCLFRSRLEARWAVFFDALGIEWQYEPQGFEFDCGRYLPDFYLPRIIGKSTGAWVEVKGSGATIDVPRMRDIAYRLPPTPAGQLDYPTEGIRLLLLGDIPERPTQHAALRTQDHKMGWRCDWQPFTFCIGDPHSFIVPIALGRPVSDTWELPEWWPNMYLPDGMLVDPRTESACRAARSARFEFGQCGAPQ